MVQGFNGADLLSAKSALRLTQCDPLLSQGLAPAPSATSFSRAAKHAFGGQATSRDEARIVANIAKLPEVLTARGT
jgi:hypothetical protein